MIDVKKVKVWNTKLKYIGNNLSLQMFNDEPYVLTEYARDMQNNGLYIIQLLQSNGVTCGVSGLHCFAFTEQEFKDNFELWDKPEPD